MNDNERISAVQAAELLLVLLPELGRAETYPQWSDGSGEPRRRQRVTLYDAAGDILGADREEHRQVLRVLLRVEPADWDRPQTFTVDGATLALTFPVVLSLPEALAGPAPSPGALLEQRHQLEDPAEPPLAVAPLAVPDAARDCARSLAEGHMTPPDWDDDPGCVPAFVQLPAVDVPVVGDAL